MKLTNNCLEVIKNNPIAIGHAIGFKDLTEIHNEWIKSLLFNTNDFTLQAHRNSFKTSCIALTMALLMVLRPNKTIMFIRKTDTDVKEVVNQVSKILQHEVFTTIVYNLYGTMLSLTENAFELTTNLFVDIRGSSQLLGCGIKGNLTGKHFDYIFTDDIVTLKDRISRAERDFTKDIYKELQNIKTRDGRICNTGTPWHKDDAFSLMPNIIKYNCYTTNIMSKDKLTELRNAMTSSLFAANYELVHISSDDVIFADSKYTNDIEAIFDGQCHVDARYMGTDKTAFTIRKKHPNGRKVMFGKVWDKHVDKCMGEIITLINKYKAGTLHLETNADKGYLAREFDKLDIPTSPYHEHMNKYVKITTFLKREWSDTEWLEDTDCDYMNMVLDYSENAENDDAPDSAASLIRNMDEIQEVTWGWQN